MAGSALVLQIGSIFGRLGRRAMRAYRVACAREDAQRIGYRVPIGAWFCERCRLVVWERHAFVLHVRAHATA
jgi:hypothetical protein